MSKPRFKLDVSPYKVPGTKTWVKECPKCGHDFKEGKIKGHLFESEPVEVDFDVKDLFVAGLFASQSTGIKDRFNRDRLYKEIMESPDNIVFLTKEDKELIEKGLDAIDARKDEQGRPTFNQFHMEALGRILNAEEVPIDEKEVEKPDNVVELPKK